MLAIGKYTNQQTEKLKIDIIISIILDATTPTFFASNVTIFTSSVNYFPSLSFHQVHPSARCSRILQPDPGLIYNLRFDESEHLKDVVLYKNKQHELENKSKVFKPNHVASIIWLLNLPIYSIEFAIYKIPSET